VARRSGRIFCGNRRKGQTRTRLDPHTSAQIIVTMKDGIDLARKYRLLRIIDLSLSTRAPSLVFHHQAVQ
jgi:membrane-associated HD superfamily phosphohydrolase